MGLLCLGKGKGGTRKKKVVERLEREGREETVKLRRKRGKLGWCGYWKEWEGTAESNQTKEKGRGKKERTAWRGGVLLLLLGKRLGQTQM